MRNFIPGIDEEYIFTRPEFAKLVGLSSNALRMRMRRGQYGDYYVLKNGKFLFKRPGAMHVERPANDHVPRSLKPESSTNIGGVKKKVNRGNHWEAVKNGSYKSKAQEQHNTMKIRAKCDGLLDQETLDLLPEAMEEAKRKKQKRLQEALNTTTQKQHAHNYSYGIINESHSGYGSIEYHSARADIIQPGKYRIRNKPKTSDDESDSFGKYYW